jgi:hypothetical protein
MMKKSILVLLSIILSITISCNNDDDTITPSATFKVTVENVFIPKTFQNNGVFDAIPPGASQNFNFNAGKGSYLSFATMFVKSNDLFYGFSDSGLELYDANGDAITGDVTMNVSLWDAGTEVNQEPGEGDNQPMNQTGPNTGEDENGTIHIVNDNFTYPMTTAVIKVTLAHDGGTMFTINIENLSDGTSLSTPFAPGVWVVHNDQAKLFTDGTTASPGMEKLAEDGDNSMMNGFLTDNSGYFSPFAPGVFAIHTTNVNPIFTTNSSDTGNGLESLAEDGDPSTLGASLATLNGVSTSGVFNTPDGAAGPGPLSPTNTYSFTFMAQEGDYLSIATMLIHSNDLFYAFDAAGIPLFTNGSPVSGNVTSTINLWDAGTEVNEYPGAGNNQPARGGAMTGVNENGVVQLVNDGFTYPAVGDAVKVTIEIQ